MSLLHTHIWTRSHSSAHTRSHLPTWLLNRLGNGFLLFNVVWSAAPEATVSEGGLAVVPLALVRARAHTLNPKEPCCVGRCSLISPSFPLSFSISHSPSNSLHSLALSFTQIHIHFLPPFLPSHFFFFMTAHISKPPGFLREPHVQYTEIVQPSGTSAAWLEKQREHDIGGRRPGWQRHPPPTLHGHQQKQKKKTEGWDHRGALAISPL